MFNHKGFTLIEMVLAIVLVSVSLTLYVTIQTQVLIIKDDLYDEKVGTYLAEHIQSMVITERRPFDLQEAQVMMDVYGNIDDLGYYSVILNQRYLIIEDTLTGKIIYEGEI
ncbi:MAG: type IV pilus modification PilV family protein [Acholeplasmataceae bacterium]